MQYILDLFTLETWDRFQRNGATVSGFVKAHQGRAANIHPGDIFVCYLVKVSRWCGLLEVVTESYEDTNPIFRDSDPYIVRFKVRPIVILEPDKALPIRLPEIWNALDRTKGIELNSPKWGGRAALQSSLARLTQADGDLLSSLLNAQQAEQRDYPFTEAEQRLLDSIGTVKAAGGVVQVVVPEPSEELESVAPSADAVAGERESIQKQALLCKIGASMGYSIWVPRSDKQRVKALLDVETSGSLLESLPVNFDRMTFRTIENIDVLWLQRSMIVRAFEVEHTTSIYSGLLRMADLLAMQPNIDIRLHIVAPDDRRDRVLSEIQRPVFALLQNGSLAKSCSFVSYDALEELSKEKYLARMTHLIIDDFAEEAEGDI